MTEFNLSEHRTDYIGEGEFFGYHEENVKEFIRRLKENLMFRLTQKQDLRSVLCQVIDKLAGDKLTEGKA